MQNTLKICLQQNNTQKINQKIPFIYKKEDLNQALRAKRRAPQGRGVRLINEAHAPSTREAAWLLQNTLYLVFSIHNHTCML